jgi:hypothetical protein
LSATTSRAAPHALVAPHSYRDVRERSGIHHRDTLPRRVPSGCRMPSRSSTSSATRRLVPSAEHGTTRFPECATARSSACVHHEPAARPASYDLLRETSGEHVVAHRACLGPLEGLVEDGQEVRLRRRARRRASPFAASPARELAETRVFPARPAWRRGAPRSQDSSSGLLWGRQDRIRRGPTTSSRS